MELRPRPILVAAIVLLAGLGWLAQVQHVPVITPKEASLFEGQGPVILAGIATGIRTGLDGDTALILVVRGDGIDVRVPGSVNVTQGEWIEAQGRVLRYSGRLTLWLTRADDLRAAAGPRPREPSWEQLATNPEEWRGQRLRIEGTVERGELRDREGHRIEVGSGPWPKEGAVQAIGILRYVPSCLCERFDASSVIVA